jgi:hypothetical protein
MCEGMPEDGFHGDGLNLKSKDMETSCIPHPEITGGTQDVFLLFSKALRIGRAVVL